MPTIHRSALVPFSPAAMFDLVNDIKQYPDFLPWCAHAEVLIHSEQVMQAKLHITKSGWSKSFTTANQLLPYQQIRMNLVEGPFSEFEGLWQFQEISNKGSQITLDLSFEFDNKLLSFTLGPLFHHIASTLVDSFTQRAHEIYASKIDHS